MKNKLEDFLRTKKLKLLYQFTILHKGWEMDNTGYIVKDQNDNNLLLLTSHENFYFGKRNQLEEKLLEYEKIVKETHQALTFLN